MRNDTLVIVGDLQINSTVGLCLDAVGLDDGGTYLPSRAQRWMADCWQKFWMVVEENKGATLHVVVNGDVVESEHHDTFQIVTKNPKTQLKMALDYLKPIKEMADYLFFVRGTPAHDGQQGYWPETLGDMLGAVPNERTGTYSWYRLLMEINGVRISIQHSPGTSSRRPWTRGSASNRLAAWMVYEYARKKERLPDLVFRSHVHYTEDSGDTHPVRVIYCPPWQLMTEYAMQLGGEDVSSCEIGGVITQCYDNRTYQVKTIKYQPEQPQPWRPSPKTISSKPSGWLSFTRRKAMGKGS